MKQLNNKKIMQNKNALYIVLGIGAGVVAYYLFCKKKIEEKASGEPDAKAEDKPTPSKAVAGGGGVFTPVMPKYVTPIATTTPLVVNVTSTPSTTPVTASTTASKTDTTLISNPVISPVSSVTTTDRPVLSSDAVTKPATSPITTPTTTTATTTTATATTPIKTSSFEGIGQQCFEVGECLYDL